jgi:hypothetical protein
VQKSSEIPELELLPAVKMVKPAFLPGRDTPQRHLLLRSWGLVLLALSTVWLLVAGVGYTSVCVQSVQLPYTSLNDSNRIPAADQQPGHKLFSTWHLPGVRECHGEGDNSICQWCNSTLTKHHPLKFQHFQRAYLPGRACSMPTAVLQKLRYGEPLQISVLGGSMTEGVACNDGFRKESACAWPSRLQERLMQVYPAANITVSNKARRGSHYGAWLEAGDLETFLDGADILIIDLQVNSQVSSRSCALESPVEIYNVSMLPLSGLPALLIITRTAPRMLAQKAGQSFIHSCYTNQASTPMKCWASGATLKWCNVYQQGLR